jgi:hypothetical protein
VEQGTSGPDCHHSAGNRHCPKSENWRLNSPDRRIVKIT